MISRTLLCLILTLVAGLGTARAQLDASLRLLKNQHVAGEQVIAVVTVTNHAGRELLFASDGRMQWLDFVVRDSRGNPVSPRGRYLFGPMKIAAGQTLAREVDLSQHFQLNRPGNFSVSAVINPPKESVEGVSTNRVTFTQSSGVLYWSQKVGLSRDPTNTRDFRVLSFAGDNKNRLYAQVHDSRSGEPVRTFPLGEVLMMRRPMATVDRKQRMHVIFLSTPSMWVHSVVDTDGRLVSRNVHQRAAQGDPVLVTAADGSVKVTNSIPYDAKANAEERAKARKASDRPFGTY